MSLSAVRASITRVIPYPADALPRSHRSVQKRWPLPARRIRRRRVGDTHVTVSVRWLIL